MREALKLFILFIPLIAFIFYSSRLKKSYFSILVSLYLISLIAISFFDVAKNISDNYSHPPEGDFLAFWMNGRAALSGENFYNAKTFQEIELPYNPSDGFREEIIDVGFWYPPFAMFLFLPLGLANFSNAFLIWQIVNVVFCFVCIYEIWKLSLREYGILSLFLIAALFLMLTPTRNTFHFAQTNFIALLFF